MADWEESAAKARKLIRAKQGKAQRETICTWSAKQLQAPELLKHMPCPPHCWSEPSGVGHGCVTTGQSAKQQSLVPLELLQLSPVSQMPFPQIPLLLMAVTVPIPVLLLSMEFT